MGVHAYCVAPAGHSTGALSGVAHQPVYALAAGPLEVWLSTHAQRPDAHLDALRAHNAVAAAGLDERVTPVPLRFGQWFDDAAAAAAAVAADEARWTGLLDTFAGHAEYGVRIADEGAANAARDVHTGSASSGRAYMAALAQREAAATRRREKAQDIAAAIDEAVRSLVRSAHAEYPVRGPALVSVAHLVAWRDAAAYHVEVKRALDDLGGAAAVVSGPWPPWSFVT